MKTTFTSRNFARIDFSDANGEACSVQESSAAREQPLLWLGLNSGTHHHITGDCMARMHLSLEQVAELLPVLQHFVEHGSLPKPE